MSYLVHFRERSDFTRTHWRKVEATGPHDAIRTALASSPAFKRFAARRKCMTAYTAPDTEKNRWPTGVPMTVTRHSLKFD